MNIFFFFLAKQKKIIRFLSVQKITFSLFSYTQREEKRKMPSNIHGTKMPPEQTYLKRMYTHM